MGTPLLYAGIDEVGRGCFAGPVVACCAVLKSDYMNPNIVDSKKISQKKREILSKELIDNIVIEYSIGHSSPEFVDTHGIVEATKSAMIQAYNAISTKIHRLAIDSINLNVDITNKIVENKAEDKYIEVAAASIIAKVYRDNLMVGIGKKYPQYLFQKNKGYGTQEHIDALKKYGNTPIHRLSFIKKYINI